MRISAISYLNTAPLMWDFEHGGVGGFEVHYTVPSQCAAELASSAADIGIIPSAAYATVPGLSILPGVAIASRQAVRSILLVSRKPMAEIRSVALDSSSLTSAALLRILFEKVWGGAREMKPVPPDIDLMFAEADAAMLIGDPALQIDRSRYPSWDLAEEWIRLTGMSFVFAFWAVRNEALRSSSLDLGGIFGDSRDHGLLPASLQEIARAWAPKVGLSEDDVQQYLTSNIYYYLDQPSLEGLQLFYRYALECNALPRVPELCFAETNPALI